MYQALCHTSRVFDSGEAWFLRFAGHPFPTLKHYASKYAAVTQIGTSTHPMSYISPNFIEVFNHFSKPYCNPKIYDNLLVYSLLVLTN